MLRLKKIYSFLFCMGLSLNSLAHFSAMDTADTLPENRYRLMLEPQVISGGPSGTNILVRFDASLNNESGFRGVLGIGSLDLQAGAFYKWAPIPDVGDQPAIALTTGFAYANYDGQDLFSLRAYPTVSKRYQWELGELNPYLSLPFSMASQDGQSLFPIQLAIGSEIKFRQLKDLDFYGEVGIEVKDSYSYISIGVAAYFDESGALIKPQKID
ncbi:MAG: hypothetical protein SGJ18_11215 [Pseudomonadota bacterium]|nr:hypothetical protein [Pseudomonadota bacterium]